MKNVFKAGDVIDSKIGANVITPDPKVESERPDLTQTQKSFAQRLFPVAACGCGLFSDGVRYKSFHTFSVFGSLWHQTLIL